MHKVFSHVRTYFRWYVFSGFVIFSILLYSVVVRENRNGILTFVVLNVGQGDSLFIESPTGTQVIVDGGPDKNLMKEISSVLPWYDRHIDMIVVTNPDLDHYSGFIPFLEKYSVDVVLEPGTQSPTDTYALLQREIVGKKIPKVLARRGQTIDLGGGAYLEILFPDRDISGLSSNDGSVVMRLVYGDTSVMLQGDSTANIEHYLASDYGGELKSTILKTGHHGSRTSTTEEYVTAVEPLWAVISSGANNSYGHPHKEVLDTLNKSGVTALDTCNNGRIIFKSDGKNFILSSLGGSALGGKNKNPKPAEVGCK